MEITKIYLGCDDTTQFYDSCLGQCVKFYGNCQSNLTEGCACKKIVFNISDFFP